MRRGSSAGGGVAVGWRERGGEKKNPKEREALKKRGHGGKYSRPRKKRKGNVPIAFSKET